MTRGLPSYATMSKGGCQLRVESGAPPIPAWLLFAEVIPVAEATVGLVDIMAASPLGPLPIAASQ